MSGNTEFHLYSSVLFVEKEFLELSPQVLLAELLLLGCGQHVKPVTPELRNYLRSKGIKLEALATVSMHQPLPDVCYLCIVAYVYPHLYSTAA